MFNDDNPDPEVRVLVALSDDTPTEILQKLSKDFDSEVRKAVASNPNTPIEILEKLGEEFPEIIIINPIFNLRLLENPDSRFVRLSLARSSTTSKETLASLAEIEDRGILLEIVRNVNTSEETLAKLAKAHWQVQEEIAFRVNTPFYIIEQLETSIRVKVARSCNTSMHLLEQLASDVDADVRVEVARNPKSSLQILENLASDEGYYFRREFIYPPDGGMDQYFVRDSGRSRGYSVRGEVARNPNSSLRILEKLASDKHSYVRAGVAENPNSSLQILEKLASDKGYFDVKECETWCLMYGMQVSESNRRYFVCEEVERNRQSSLQIVEKAASNLKRLKQGKRKK